MALITTNIGSLAIRVKTGSTPKTDQALNFEDPDYNWFTPGDFSASKLILKYSSRKISQYAAENSATLFDPKTVLITCIGDIGNCGIVLSKSSANQQITGVLVDENIINPYLFNYLIRNNKRILQDKSNKAVVPILNNKNLKEIKLTFPEDLETQNKIVAVLDKAKAILNRREQTITKYDELLQAIFMDKFSKYQGTNISLLVEIADIKSGLTKGKKHIGKSTRMVPYMRVANVQDGFLDLTKIKEIEATEEEVNRYNLTFNDLLLTEGGDPDKLGRGTLWKNQIDGCIFQNHIFRVQVKNTELINPVFLSFQLSSLYGKNYFLKAAKQTSGIASINSTQLKAFPVYIPPFEIQHEFAEIVAKINTLQSKLLVSKYEIGNLFNVLSQYAFKGELNFNTSVDLEILLENDYAFFRKNSNSQSIRLLLEKFDKDAIENKKFFEPKIYDKAKIFVFELLKEGKVKQVFEKSANRVKLTVNETA